MKKILYGIVAAAGIGMLLGGCKKRESYIELNYPGFDGEKVELISFNDSTVLQTAMLTGGKAKFDNSEILSDGGEQIAQVVIDGRIKGFLIIEEGNAYLADTMSVASGTPLNEDFRRQIVQLDSVENLNDMLAYARFAAQKYKAAKAEGSVLADYFGIEWLKYGEPAEVKQMLSEAPESFRESKRAQRYARYAELRGKTAVGEKYTDFEASTADGAPLKLSGLVKPGGYTLIDFWASWCPYCIKELPELKQLYSQYHSKGFEIVGVAVRDEVADTKESVAKHELPWPVMYDAKKKPYDIYGFSGIPYLILVGPDGKIVARGESAAQTAARLNKIFK